MENINNGYLAAMRSRHPSINRWSSEVELRAEPSDKRGKADTYLFIYVFEALLAEIRAAKHETIYRRAAR